MGRATYLIFVFCLLLAPTAHAGEADICEAYRSEQSRLQCADPGYLMGTGYRLCLEFVRVDKEFSPAGRLAMAKIRRCLTEALETAGRALTCENAEQVGYGAHVGCYVAAGFCDLSLEDQAVTFSHLGEMLLQPRAWEQFLKLEVACAGR